MDKKLYITTALPYVNATTPHIGNVMDWLLADIWARYQKQNGRNVRFQTGTDEHGSKIAAKAKELNKTSQEYVDQVSVNFEEVMKKMDLSRTDYLRTTDPRHEQAVQAIWQKLAPHIYKNTYEGWYCVGCEAFVTDQDAAEHEGTCPEHQQPYQRLKEENYFFRASDFSQPIREAVESGEMKIVPEFRKKEFLDLIKNGLQDVSISRPRKNLSWGISVPDDPSQVMYVWPDALLSYITVLGYPNDDEYQNYWPADVQVLGKDILRFHAGLWPAMLLALDLSLPKTLLAHGFINVGGTKMSKTVGNVIDPAEIMNDYGVEAFRYYFARHIPTFADGDFTWEKFEAAYNTELANDLGNLVQRIAGMITRYQAGVIGTLKAGEHDMGAYHAAMDNLEFDKAFDEAWDMVHSLNQYIDHVKPWDIAKNAKDDKDAEAHLSDVLSYSVNAILQIADLLVPFLPATASTIHEMFGSGVVKSADKVLFPKIYKHQAESSVSIASENSSNKPC